MAVDADEDRALSLMLAIKGLLDAAARLWPELDDVPAELREPVWQLHLAWVDTMERALRDG